MAQSSFRHKPKAAIGARYADQISETGEADVFSEFEADEEPA
jgi:hypothetical protein